MDSIDITVTANDVQAYRQQVKEHGLTPIVEELFQYEPVLEERYLLRWGSLQEKLVKMELSEEQVQSVLATVARMTLETLTLLRRGQRRLWDGFLPESMDGKDGNHG